MHNKKFTRIQILVISLLIVEILMLSTLLFILHGQKKEIQKKVQLTNSETYSQIFGKIKEIKKSHTAAFAWNYLVKNYKPSISGIHDIAHFLGASIYDEQQLDGLKSCSSSIGFGCYHGFIEEFIVREGIEKIPELTSKCDMLLFVKSCYHGIGHGLLTYFKYSLPLALENCDKFTKERYQENCYSGVFMENGSHKKSQGKKNDPLWPCNSVEYKYKYACYQYQIYFLHTLFNDDYRAVFQACESEVERKFANRCIQGIGEYLAQIHNYDSKKVISTCNIDSRSKNTCIDFAAVVATMYGIPLDTVKKEYCNQQKISERNTCISLIENQKEEIDIDQ